MTGCYPASSEDSLSDFHWESSYGAELLPEAWISLPLILNKKFGLPVSVMLYVFDFLILIGQALFCDKEAILYGILLVMTYTIVLDKILVIGQAQTQVKIISQKSDEINEAITRKMDRGSTLLHTETGYLHSRQNMILTSFPTGSFQNSISSLWKSTLLHL